MSILGPSGCGKTTTLRIIGGFITPDRGDVFFNGQRINDLPPHKRTVNTIFQRYALFPHLNIFDNIAFGLRIAKVDESEIKKRVDRMLHLVNLPDYGSRRTFELSGGEQQRIAIARSLLNEPQVIIADEPTGNLDNETADGIMKLLTGINSEKGTAIVMVTHNRQIFEKYKGRVMVCRNETCEEQKDEEIIDLELTI
mgnify:CR=1 FL=1